MTIQQMLKAAEQQLDANGSEQSLAKILLVDALEMESYEILMRLNEQVEPAKEAKFMANLARFIEHNEPVQYIIGYEYFMGRNFHVSDAVLIPRPETEELVYHILDCIDDYFPDTNLVRCCDVGTGSGAISVSLAAECEKVTMVATDISEEALLVAKQNAADFAPQVSFMAGDMVQPLIDAGVQVDIFISNPPYIPAEEQVDSLVKDNEPHVALFGGNDGLYFYRKIFDTVTAILAPKRNMLAFEMGYDQGDRLSALAAEYFPTAEIEVKQDINGKDRMLFIYNNVK
ncbi:MAG: peptide chain release factor N(5)-glutamine methyltransferase [Culicoidibacterales bacterium]